MTITDLSLCRPASAMSAQSRFDVWNLIRYETREHSGLGIYVPALRGDTPDESLELTLPLGASGWHAIHLGLWDPDGPPNRAPGCGLRLKLSGDAEFQQVAFDVPTKMYLVQEGLWREADMSGQDLIVRPSAGKRAGMAWVRLEPVDEREVTRRRAKKPEKIVIAKYDNASFLTAEGVEREMEKLSRTDFTHVFLADGLDVHWMRSNKADHRVDRLEAAVARRGLPASSLAAHQVRARDQGIDPIDLLDGPAHKLGLEIHAGLRISKWRPSPPMNHADHGSRFYEAHPEWRCRDRDGTEIPKMSFAFKEVRDYVVGMYRDVAEAHAGSLDGLNVLFIRGPVFLLFEQPLIEGFQKESGRDPRDGSPWDEGWLRFRAGFITEFVREMRRLCEELKGPNGKRLQLSANILGSRIQNLAAGRVPEAWIEEGLVDMLIPQGIPWPNANWAFELEYLADLRRRSQGRCPVVVQVPNTYRPMSLGHLRTVDMYQLPGYAHRLYEAGLDGLYFWDTYVTDGLAARGMLQGLGRPDQVRLWADAASKAYMTRDDSGGYIEVTSTGDGGEGSGRPGGEYGWMCVPPTTSHLMDKLGGVTVGRYWRDSGC